MNPSFNTGSGPRKRRRVSKEDLKRLYGDQCRICGKSEKDVGTLEMAHYRAHSRGGDLVFLLCPNHHRKYDNGLLSNAELKKIGLTRERYERYIPKKNKPSNPDPKYYYRWGDSKRNYQSEATLPASACRPRRHSWEQGFTFNVWQCTKCKAMRYLR